MLGETKRCANCMSEIGDNVVCPECGYIKGSPYSSAYLAPSTVLNERYVVGCLKSYNNESATYIGFDREIQTIITIKEYLPDKLVERETTTGIVRIKQGCEPQYKNLLADFVELGENLMKLSLINPIVHVYEVLLANNTAYSINEYAGDKNLNQYLAENAGELSWEEASNLFEPVLKALISLHEVGIVHKGLSPSTIKINKRGEAKIDGFAISALRSTDDIITPELFRGYAAPEQYSPQSFHSANVDVYGIAAVIYKAITGTMPPDAMGRSINDNIVAPNILNSSIPVNVSNGILEALKLSPSLRILTIKELYIKLYIENKTNAAVPISPEKEEKSGLSKKKTIIITMAIAFVVVTLIVLTIIFIILGGRGGDNNEEIDSSLVSSEEVSLPEESVISSEGHETSENTKTGTLMPNLIGLEYNMVANSSVYKQLFTLNPPNYSWSNEYAEGIIIDQSVPVRTELTEGQVVTVAVSRGPQKVQIPDYEGVLASDYKAKLDALGILYREEFRPDSTRQNNYVSGIDRNPGDMYDKEVSGQITIYVVKN